MEIINKILEEHEILEQFSGRIITKVCRFIGQEKNQYWLVRNKKTNEEYYLMDVSNNRLTIIDKESINKVLEFDKTLTVCNNYVVMEIERNKKIALHAFLMNHYGNGLEKGSLSVDHINQNKMDNRICNLRITTQSVQNSNRKYSKNENSKYNLNRPEGMETIDLPRYVEYKIEYRDKENKKGVREYFILSHPNCPKYGTKNCIVSTKSAEKTAMEKFEFILEKMKEFDIEIKYC